MSSGKPLMVRATWDEHAGVWVAESEDAPGLATEAETMDLLVEKLKVMIPELLDANGHADGDEFPFELVSTLTAKAHRYA